MTCELIVAPTAGFCYGVSRAVALARETRKTSGRDIYTLGKLIHNDEAVAALEAEGIHAATSPAEIPEGSTVVLRAHGVTPAVREELEKKNCLIVDGTCPSVTKIHQLVKEAEKEERVPVIIGDKNHPEVIGIVGESAYARVLAPGDTKDAEKYFSLKTTFFAQTTSDREQYKIFVDFLKKHCTNSLFRDTICFATEKRQKEAAAIASACDAMIVIGDPISANTGKLASVCARTGTPVYRIRSANEVSSSLPQNLFTSCRKIGITAGASVPDVVIKEVRKIMSEELKNPVAEAQEENFGAMLEENLKSLRTGERVTGIVTSITGNEVQVDLGAKHSGILPLDELSENPNAKVEELIKVGDEIEVMVGKVSDAEGTAMLSKKRVDALKTWDDLSSAMENEEILEGVVESDNKGGVVIKYRGIEVFVPASMTGVPKDTPLSTLVGKKVHFILIEVNSNGRKRAKGNIRRAESVLRKAKADEVWANIEVGKTYHGTVKSLTGYGAFVDIGGVDGMVHLSELSWARIHNPAEVVSVGDELDVYVIKFDSEARKISLGYKDPEKNPWKIFRDQYEVGDICEVRVVRLADFGAFAEIVPGVDGLIHISQLADHRVEKPADAVERDEIVRVKIISIDDENQKVGLSIRQAIGEDEESDSYTEE